MPNAQRSEREPYPWVFDLGDRLDKALRVAGVSVGDMATTLDVSRNTIGNYTSGRTKPSRLQIREWAARTGAPVRWLETGELPGPETTKAPTPEGEGQKLPGLDSNQEPIGMKPKMIPFPHERAVRAAPVSLPSVRPIVKLSAHRNAS